MRILLYCYAFYPSIGGIEAITKTMAESFIEMGYACTVVTETPAKEPDNFPFEIKRVPSKKEILSLIRRHDVICNVELSMKFFVLCKIARKPLIWVHNGYKLMCIDAFGWYKDAPAPMQPWKSITFYGKHEGWAFAMKEGVKLYGRRIASRFIFRNVAESLWVAKRQPLKRQVHIYTPFTLDSFKAAAGKLNKEYDFLYLGRLVPEKGVDILLRAFHLLLEKRNNQNLKLAIVGYGSAKEKLEKLSAELGISDKVFFLGPKRGQDLVDSITKTEITVVPSFWEEPLGGVALEAIAAGRIPIVAQNGGLQELVGDAGLTFMNGNYEDLYEKMNMIIDNPELKEKLRAGRATQLEKFETNKLVKQFIDLFSEAVK